MSFVSLIHYPCPQLHISSGMCRLINFRIWQSNLRPIARSPPRTPWNQTQHFISLSNPNPILELLVSHRDFAECSVRKYQERLHDKPHSKPSSECPSLWFETCLLRLNFTAFHLEQYPAATFGSWEGLRASFILLPLTVLSPQCFRPVSPFPIWIIPTRSLEVILDFTSSLPPHSLKV